MPIKVSVVVPTYAPGELIDVLVRSLEAQTMPASDFEVIFVDDGSPDDTWSVLEGLRDSHQNWRIERIENSGWPSRPRNVGLELAQGEYVLFMDHDDELYPRALEAGYAFAARTNADVLNGKETRTDQSKWAVEIFTENMDNSIDRPDIHPLMMTNPHKLFRRALLMEHNIRFQEGRRVLWEDVFFNLDVAQHAKVIATMSDVPFYHWVRNGVTASTSYTEDVPRYWHWVCEIVKQTNEKLAGPGFEQQWRLFLGWQYLRRILPAVNIELFALGEEELATVRGLIEEVLDGVPVEFDADLPPSLLGRAVLVRARRWDLLEKLVAIDVGILGVSTTTSTRWIGGKLRITTEARWADPEGRSLALRRDGDRLVRDLPADVEAALPPEALDLTKALTEVVSALSLRSRDTAVVWMIPSETEVRVDDVDGRPEIVATAIGMLDPRTAIFGRPLDERIWDFHGRNELLSLINQRGVRTESAPRAALVDGHLYICFENKGGVLSLDVDESIRSLAGAAKPDLTRASIVSGGSRWGKKSGGIEFALPFAGSATVDESVVEGTITVGSGAPQPARLVARRDGIWLESSISEKSGTYPLTMNFFGRDTQTGVQVVIKGKNELSFI